MTQIEVTDGDIAEALGLVPSWGNGPQAIAAVKAYDWRWFGRGILAQIRAHARTIAQLRVAREALEAANKAATTMRNSSKLVGQYPNDPKRNQDWIKTRYHDGREILAITKPALAQITQDTPE